MNILSLMADNAARRAVLTVTPLAAGMSAAALQNDKTSNVCRAPGSTMKIVVVFNKPVMIGAVSLRGNFSSTSTVRTVSFSDTGGAGSALLQDTDVRLARPWPDVPVKGIWTEVQWASAYRYGGGARARSFMTNHLVRRLELYLSDPDNLQGYIEVADIFAGRVWAPSRSPDYNPSRTASGTGESFRDGDGGLRSIKGTKFDSMAVSLSHMSEADRAEFWEIQLGNGTDVPMFVSLYPNDPSGTRERDHQMYGCLVETAAMRRPNFAEHATDIEWVSK